MARQASSKPADSTANLGFKADFGPPAGSGPNTFRRDLHPDPRADYVLANPPFNDSDTALRGSAFLQCKAISQVVSEAKDNFRKDDDVRWQSSRARKTAKGSPQGERGGVHQFGVPPKGNANFAWVQHFIHHLAPQTAMRDSAFHQCKASPQVVSEAKDNMAGVDSVCLRCATAVLANGSMSSNQSGEGDIRRALIEADLVDCMVALPGQLFYSTQIPVCLWFCLENGNASTATFGLN